jgi:hypothetical protein
MEVLIYLPTVPSIIMEQFSAGSSCNKQLYHWATQVKEDLSAATFNNCIIYGSYANEMSLNKNRAAFEYQFNNCLLNLTIFRTNLVQIRCINLVPIQHITTQSFWIKIPTILINLRISSISMKLLPLLQRNSMYLIPLHFRKYKNCTPDLGAYQNKTFPK